MNDDSGKKPERYIRVQVHFHPDDFSELVKLRDKWKFRTFPNMIRRALQLLKVYLQAKEDGYSLQLAKGDDVKTVIFLD